MSSPGIVEPLKSYQFWIEFLDLEDSSDISRQVMSANIDLVNQKLKIKIRQPVLPMYDRINKLQDCLSIVIQPKDGPGNPCSFRLLFKYCKMTSHNSSFDYSSGEIVIHDLEFHFKELSEELNNNLMKR